MWDECVRCDFPSVPERVDANPTQFAMVDNAARGHGDANHVNCAVAKVDLCVGGSVFNFGLTFVSDKLRWRVCLATIHALLITHFHNDLVKEQHGLALLFRFALEYVIIDVRKENVFPGEVIEGLHIPDLPDSVWALVARVLPLPNWARLPSVVMPMSSTTMVRFLTRPQALVNFSHV